MKSKEEICARTEAYRLRLYAAVLQKESLGEECAYELELTILSLINKLEMLFWVLEFELAEDDLLDGYATVYQ